MRLWSESLLTPHVTSGVCSGTTSSRFSELPLACGHWPKDSTGTVRNTDLD
jgi:hypothetical protein